MMMQVVSNTLSLFSVYLALTSLPERIAFHFDTNSLSSSAQISKATVLKGPFSQKCLGYWNKYPSPFDPRTRKKLRWLSHSISSPTVPIKKTSLREKWRNYCESMGVKMREFKFIADYIWPAGRDNVRLKIFLVIAMGFMYL